MDTLFSTAAPIVYGLNSSELSWNTWTSWTECTASCAGGQMMRLMLCEGMKAPFNQCPHHLMDAKNFALAYDLEWLECSMFPCPVNGYWSEWLQWTECSATCDIGTRLRRRTCIGPFNNGLKCHGFDQENDFCLNDTCATGSSKARVLTFEEEQEKIRYKQSDHRTSAIGTGVLSLIFLLLELGLIISFDVLTLSQQLSFCIRNLKLCVAAIKKFKYHRVDDRAVSLPSMDSPAEDHPDSPIIPLGRLSQDEG